MLDYPKPDGKQCDRKRSPVGGFAPTVPRPSGVGMTPGLRPGTLKRKPGRGGRDPEGRGGMMEEQGAAQGQDQKPKKPHSQKCKRPYHIFVRLTAEEDALLRAKANAASKTPGAFLRAVITGHPIKAIPKHPEDYYRNLRQIGNNLNQIAKHLNSGAIPSKSELEETVTACAEVLKNASR